MERCSRTVDTIAVPVLSPLHQCDISTEESPGPSPSPSPPRPPSGAWCLHMHMHTNPPIGSNNNRPENWGSVRRYSS